MALASSTTTAAALTVRLDPELVAPSLQPSKPWTCCCTLDRPEKRPGATLFAGNCTQQRSLRLAAHFQDWLVLGAPGGWCWCWYKVQGLVAGGESGSWEQLEVQRAACATASDQPNHCRLELDQSGLLRLLSRSLLFSVLNIGLVLMINLPHDIIFQLFLNQPVVFRVLAPKKN